MLEIDGLTKRYGPVVALDDASFDAAPGRIVGFLGPNGAGKTTTMRCVFGLVSPERGEVRWESRRVGRDERLRFGYMPEQRGLYPRMRVGEQLTYLAQQHGLPSRAASAATARWLDRLGIADRSGSKLETLSHGNQQRVQLAAALVHDPELLVLDEPFAGLDPIGTATMSEVLRERVAAGVTVLFSSHQLDLVEDICEDVVIIAGGRIAAHGPIDALRAASPRRHLDVEVAGSGGGWVGELTSRLPPGAVTVVERDGDRTRMLLEHDQDLAAVLETAQRAGAVVRFSYEPPHLSELFMEAVGMPVPDTSGNGRAGGLAATAGTPPDGGGPR
jgi:ABC-2 type transport system ATP-binding protein